MIAPSPWPCQNGRKCFTHCPGCPGPDGEPRGDARETVTISHAERKLRVLVTGGRNYAHRDKVFDALYALLEVDDDHWMGKVELTIIHGDCHVDGKLSGADLWAEEFAQVNWCQIMRFPADWNKYGSKYAGFYRNQQMIDEGKPDLVLAFPGGNGTADMKVRAINSGIEVREIR